MDTMQHHDAPRIVEGRHPIWTCKHEHCARGAVVELHTLSSGAELPALFVGEQVILLVPAGGLVRVERTGRLYDDPPVWHYRVHDDSGRVTVSTPDDEDLL